MTALLERFKPRNLQLLLWTLITIMLCTCYMLSGEKVRDAIVLGTNDTFFYILIIYVNILLLIPFLYERKNKMTSYILASLAFLLFTTYLRVHLQHYFHTRLFPEVPVTTPVLFKTYSFIFISHVLIFLSSIGFKLALSYFTVRIQKEQLLKQQSVAELNLLKAQVQPHFLFNTLNNIYCVAERESPATASLLEELAVIMRYFVDDAPKEKIPLENELNFIENYISLETMRMRYPLTVAVNKNVSSEVLIPPMLLIPLVENVFKHGINHLADTNYLNIKIQESNKALEVTVENPCEQNKPAAKTGTGLKNLDDRLTLLFGNRYQLTSNTIGKAYKARIRIPI